jgi:hypothetical protein
MATALAGAPHALEAIKLQQQQCGGAAGLADAAAAAVAAAASSSSAGAHMPPLHRRVLRFVFGGLTRAGSPQQYQHPNQRRRRAAVSDGGDGGDGGLLLLGRRPGSPRASLYSDAVSDAATEDTGSEDVLGMSPFASCADLQNYRAALQQQRAARAAAAAAEAAAARRAAAAGPLRRALAWLLHGARRAAAHVSPQGPGNNDTTLFERVTNVATSVPFLVVGVHSLRWVRGRRDEGAPGAACHAATQQQAVWHGNRGSHFAPPQRGPCADPR